MTTNGPLRAPDLDPVRPGIRALRAYESPAEEAPRLLAKLDFNESPFDVPVEVKEAVLARLAARRWSLYPEFGAPRLKAAIAAATGRREEEIVVGNGSGEVIQAAVNVFAGSGGTLLLAPPTFSLYGPIAALAGAHVVPVPRVGAAFEVDETAFLGRPAARPAAASVSRSVPLLCSPNNPTGGVVSRAFVASLCDAFPAVLLDQAYVDFAEGADDALELLDERPNLVVFRTLSKAYAAAGFRIGYAVARPDLAREIEKAILPFSVDLAAEELAVAVLARRDLVAPVLAGVVAERARVADALRAAGARVAPSRANFLFFSPRGGDGRALRAALLSRGVLVRDMDAAAGGHLRVTIGAREENDLFLALVKELS